MVDSATIADGRYREVQAISRSVVAAVQGIWRTVTPDRILSAMQGPEGAAVLRAVVAGQLTAAEGAQAFVGAAMAAQGAMAAPLAALDPSALAGIAMDGRPLGTLLYQPAITTARALAVGESAEVAALRGMTQMALMVGTTVADTNRAASAVAMSAHPRVNGYVRVVHLPACARCIVLAGRQYSRSNGFSRHPGCDCSTEPLSDAEAREVPTPDDLFRQMTPEEQHRRLGAAGVKAMEHGADLGQLVNARRGMSTVTGGVRGDLAVTTEGTTKRGLGARAMGSEMEKRTGVRFGDDTSARPRTREARLMPETIIQLAKGNRELELSQLKKHGYVL
ncbi:VG15 protein [Kitasatospora griseola]